MTTTTALATATPAPADPVLARMRSAHLKATADAALAAGNAGEAARTYGEAGAALPPGEPPAARARLAANASLAWLRAGRASAALHAATTAITLAPGWDKAHWRAAAALAAGGRHADALAALRACAAAGGERAACGAAAARAVARLPRRDVARCMLSLLEDGARRGDWPASSLGDGGGAGAGVGLALSAHNSPPALPPSSPATTPQTLALLPDVRPATAAASPTASALLAAAERLVAAGEGRAAEDGLAGEGEEAPAPPPSPSPAPAPASDAPPPPPTVAGAASALAGRWRPHLASWFLDPAALHPATALAERSAVAAEAGAWGAAVADARAAVAAAVAGEAETPPLPPPLAARAHLRLGEALLAAPGVASRDCAAAAAAAAAGLARLGQRPPPPLVVGGGGRAPPPKPSPADQEARRLRAGLASVLRGAEAALPPGAVGDAVRGGGRATRPSVRLSVRFPPPAPAFGPAVRVRLVSALAAAAGPGVPLTAVTLEGVRRGGDGGLTVAVAVAGGGDSAPAARAAARLEAAALAWGGGGDGPRPVVTVEAGKGEGEEAPPSPTPALDLAAAGPSTTTALTSLPPPLPRARLTTAAGTPLDGPPRAGGGTAARHPFRLSRIHYVSRDLPPDAWVELPDGRVRWRQSAGEVRVVVAAVPPGTRPADLAVSFRPRRATVSLRACGSVLWDARLARHVTPSECTWTHGCGEGEDGLVLCLAKANLELLAAGAAATPADTWWPALTRPRKGEGNGRAAASPDDAHPAAFTGAVAWDDYDKDYSDLPAPFLAAAAAADAASAAERAAEAAERAEREACAAEDGARVRARADRLDAMRGAVLSAVM